MRSSALWAAGLAVALAVPRAAHPYDLPQLLSMPLERLLQLKISSRGAAMAAVHRSPTTAAGTAEGHNHAP